MRHMSPQLPLTAPWIAHAHAAELAAMSALLDEQTGLAVLVQQDLEDGCAKNPRTGRPGLTGEQTLRILILRQLTGWTYAELAFHLADSATYRAFCRVSAVVAPPSKSAVAATLRRVRPATLAKLNDRLVTSATARAVEPARTVRMDATVVPVAIHPPTDSTLLLDAVRVLQRLLRRAEREVGFTAYHRHLKRAKRRAVEIRHLAPRATQRRRACYRELLHLAEATASYATCALAQAGCLPPTAARSTRRRRRLLREEARARHPRHGAKRVGLRQAPALPSRDREWHLALEAGLRAGAMRVERRGGLSRVRPHRGPRGEPPATRAPPSHLTTHHRGSPSRDATDGARAIFGILPIAASRGIGARAPRFLTGPRHQHDLQPFSRAQNASAPPSLPI